jgi:hypothetical protein
MAIDCGCLSLECLEILLIFVRVAVTFELGESQSNPTGGSGVGTPIVNGFASLTSLPHGIIGCTYACSDTTANREQNFSAEQWK